MERNEEFIDLSSVNVAISDDESNSDGSDPLEMINAHTNETKKLLPNDLEVAYRRPANGNHHASESDDNEDDDEDDDDDRFYLSHKSSRQNRSLRQFLILFGFASSLIIISQLYLSMYYNDPLGRVIVNGWDRNRSRSIPFYILPDVNTTVIEPSTLCKYSDTEPILLLIVVCSATDNFDIRQTIRQTWANTTEFNYSRFSSMHSDFKGKYLRINYPDWMNFTIKSFRKRLPDDDNVVESLHETGPDSSQANFFVRVVFLVGRTESNESQARIEEESAIYDDVIQEDFLDSYNNLTLKTVMMLKWVNKNCVGKVKFLMKCDDDTFVNIPNLIHFLLGGTIPVYDATVNDYNEQTIHSLSTKNRLSQYDDLLIGARFCRSKPISNTNSKWFTPRYMYDKKVYPNYLSGIGYVFTMDTAAKLYNASMSTPLLHLEDVYLTGICAEKAQIEPQNHPLFNYLSYKDLCEFKGMIAIHEIKPTDMKKAHDFMISSNVTCPGPSRRATIRTMKQNKKYCE